MPKIIINGQTIFFPDVNQSPNWAPSVIQFAQATEDAFNSVANSYDISTQKQTMGNAFKMQDTSGVALNDLLFPKTSVASFIIYYTITKSITDPSIYTESENGKIDVRINSSGVYEMTRDASGDASITFRIDDSTGQVYIINNKTYITGDVVVFYRATVIPLT